MTYLVLDTLGHQSSRKLHDQLAFDVLMGLSGSPKFLPSKYFYDARGSQLFEQIMELKEYYLTRCEFEILTSLGGELASLIGGEEVEIIELGAGDGRKTRVLLEQLLAAGTRASYVPVDISESAVAELLDALGTHIPGLPVQGIVGDYFDSLRYLENTSNKRKLVLFLGSNVGNFDFRQALGFLRTLWKSLSNGDYLLIGFDLKKDIPVMLQAYNDAEGITRAFNLNLLARLNRELDADFDLSLFTHHALYNPERGAMESYLISMSGQQVRVGELAKNFHFKPFEPIHLEYSYKYLLSDIDAMARDTGFRVLNHWLDARGWFADSLWQVRKDA